MKSLPLLRIGIRLYRRHFAQIFFFSACIAAGVAFLFAIGNLLGAIDRAVAERARELLAADVKISSNRPFSERALDVLARAEKEGVRRTKIVSFSSMLRPAKGRPFLVSVKAVERAYPFYGELKISPPGHEKAFFEKRACLIDGGSARSHGIALGDIVHVGRSAFKVVGFVDKEPDRGLTNFNLAPRLFLPLDGVASTGLIQTGSRIRYQELLAAPQSDDPAKTADALKESLDKSLEDPYVNISAYGDAQPTIRRVLSRIFTFFVLVSLIALLVGAVGMSAGVTLFLNGQLETVGILRCLGLTTGQVARIYYGICMAVGVQGGLMGAVAGWGLSAGALKAARQYLKLSVSASSAFSIGPLIEALALACVIALGVNAGKVSALSRLSPLAVLRERTKRLPPSRWASFLTIAAAATGVFAYTFYKSNSSEVARNFSVGLLGSGAALVVLIAAGLRLFEMLSPLMTGRRFFAFRHGLIELTRNKARSLVFLFTLSAGFTLIGALTLVHHSLSKEILLGKADDVPDMFLVDIQKSQRQDVERMINAYVKQPPLLSPLIRARLTHINGNPILRRDLSAMTVEDRRKHRFLTREYNLTYKDRLNDSEEIIEGAFWKPGESRVQISLEKGFEKMTGVALGDKMTFDIQGRSIDADVTSVRSINWMSMNPNFFVVFPESALERAPQNFVGSLRIGDPKKISEFQKKLIERFPNISVVDLSQILDNIQSVLEILLTALTVVAWFCVAVGLLVLAGTLSLGHRERREHAALFRALGASFKDILLIDAFELLSIGTLTFAISAAVSYGLGAYISQKMEITFAPDAAASVWIPAAALALPLAVGLAVSWKTYRSPVLETLRRET